jgi:uncharacterized protein YjbI with pentapeptide repeats
MTVRAVVDPPDLPELEPERLDALDPSGGLELSGALVDGSGQEPLVVQRVRITESELRGVTLAAPTPVAVSLVDVVLRDCDLSNLDARGISMRRCEVHDSKLLGVRASEGTVQDLRVTDCAMLLASFADTELRHVVFERVNLAEASFMRARLEAVEFIDCGLTGADFRGARLKRCVIRGASLDGVIGVDSLAGVTMPWSDVVASAAALAASLGIAVEAD